MANEKRRKFSRKLRSLFATEEWRQTPIQNDPLPGAGPDSDTALAVLNSGISLKGQIITQLDDESLCASEQQSPQADATPDLRGQVLAPTSPILQSPMSPITAYAFDNPDDDMLAQDRERTHMRYQAAVARLKEALELRSTVWSDQGPLEFADLLEKDDASELSTIIENRLNHVSNASPISKKARKLFQQIFVVFFPLTRNLLLVAKEAQAIPLLNPCGLICGGLLLLLTIANRELTRSEEIETTIEYISRELARVKTAGKLKIKDLDCVGLGYRAMDVRTAVLDYLAVHIRRESKGIIGNVAKTLLKGDTDCESATRNLQAAVTEFNSALILLNTGMAFLTIQKLGHIGNKVDEVTERLQALELRSSDELTATEITSFSSHYKKYIIPYEKNEHFTGRQSLLANLCEKLCIAIPKRYNHRVALHGLGGVGKTQLALEYVYTHKALHDRIYWISGVDQASLLSGYEEIGRRVGCIENYDDTAASDVAKSVLAWLNKEEGWLLVIDNVDDSTVIDGYLPERSPRQLTLLTTRNPNSDEFAAEALEVEVLGKDDAIDLLSVRSGAELLENEQIRPEAELEEIVREVGCLPLAIEQAAAYIREVSKDIFKFLPSYRRNRKHHHNRKPKGNWKYGESIASTWHLSFKQVEQNNKGASKLLQLLAFLNPDGIYTDFLEAGNDALELDLQEVIGDPDLFHEALFELERFSLIRGQLRDGSQRVTIHRLVQSVIIDDMDQSEREVMMVQAVRLGISAFPDATQLNLNPNSLELSRRYRSQVMACLGHRQSERGADAWHFLSVRVAAFLYADGYYEECAKLASKTVDASKIYRGPDHTETLQSMHKLASTFRKLARGDDAMKMFQETLAVRTRVLGSEHLDTLRTMYGLACAFTDFAQPAEATRLHTESLAIRRRLLGNEHPETVQSMNGLAFAYWKLGEYHTAAALHEEALMLGQKIQGLRHTDTLSSMDGLGWAKWRLGEYQQASRLFQDALNFRKKFQKDDHPDTVSSMDGLAWSYWRLGEYQKATSVFQEILEINKRMPLGLEHPDAAMNLYGLAWGHSKLGRYTKAIEIFQEAHEITSRILGPHHPDTLLNWDGLAWCYWSLGEYEQSLKLHQKTLDYYRKTLGHNHPDTMFSIYGAGWSQLSLGNYEKAEKLFQERIDICSVSLYPDHRDTLLSEHGLASAYEKMGRYDEALELFSKTFEKRSKALAPDHPETLESMNGLASIYRAVGRHQESMKLFQETLIVRTRIFGEEHPDTLQTIFGMATCLHEMGTCVEAESLYIKAWRGWERILGQNHPDTVNCINSLALCYELGGRQEEADQMRQMIPKGTQAKESSIHIYKDPSLS